MYYIVKYLKGVKAYLGRDGASFVDKTEYPMTFSTFTDAMRYRKSKFHDDELVHVIKE